MLQVSTEAKTSRKKPGNGKRLSVVFDEYIGEMVAAGVWNQKSEEEKRASLNGLVEIVGDLPIDALSYDVGREYKNKLMKLPANRNKMPEYRDLKMAEILELHGIIPMSTRTVNNNLATEIAAMNWARKQGYKITAELIRKLMGWRHSGFSIDNGIRIERGDEKGREAIAQYIMQNVFIPSVSPQC